MREIRDGGAPKLPYKPKTRADGTVTVQVFPSEKWDPLFYKDMNAEIWMDESVSEALHAVVDIVFELQEDRVIRDGLRRRVGQLLLRVT